MNSIINMNNLIANKTLSFSMCNSEINSFQHNLIFPQFHFWMGRVANYCQSNINCTLSHSIKKLKNFNSWNGIKYAAWSIFVILISFKNSIQTYKNLCISAQYFITSNSWILQYIFFIFSRTLLWSLHFTRFGCCTFIPWSLLAYGLKITSRDI